MPDDPTPATPPPAETVLAWHFLADSGLLRDGRTPPPDGEWLEHDGPLVLCESGMHASERAIDAMRYAPGASVCRVECGGEILRDDDKLVASRRRILWRADATETLRLFARRQALSVIHLWDVPEVVRRYLETGDESLRAAASAAASAAARDAARAAAWAAEIAAASAAARDAARAAAWDAANIMLTEMLEGLRPAEVAHGS